MLHSPVAELGPLAIHRWRHLTDARGVVFGVISNQNVRKFIEQVHLLLVCLNFVGYGLEKHMFSYL